MYHGHKWYIWNNMNITINTENTQPLFAQLVDQIKLAVSGGHLKAGDQLPSIRQLAADLDINNKTVAKAYGLLERDEVIVAKGYRGSFIHPDAVANSQVDFKATATDKLKSVIIELKAAGVTDTELRQVFAEILSNN